MIQHDMLLWTMACRVRTARSLPSSARRPTSASSFSRPRDSPGRHGSRVLFRDANESYATDYPAAVGNHMVKYDSNVFMNIVPAISLREKERGMQVGAGWNPHYHQPAIATRPIPTRISASA